MQEGVNSEAVVDGPLFWPLREKVSKSRARLDLSHANILDCPGGTPSGNAEGF